ncbi:hypothetical protein KIW84_011440, partial [Lathyrus oleraceus]
SAATVSGGRHLLPVRNCYHSPTVEHNTESKHLNTLKQKNPNFTMQELDQWKEQISHLLNVANDYIREIPTDQLYAAAAIAVFTTLVLLLLRGSGKTVSLLSA